MNHYEKFQCHLHTSFYVTCEQIHINIITQKLIMNTFIDTESGILCMFI